MAKSVVDEHQEMLLQPTLMVDEPVTDTEGLALKPGIKSPIWEYFGLKKDKDGKPVDNREVLCKICHRVVLVRNGNTSI